MMASYDYNDAMAEAFAAYKKAIEDGIIPPTMEFDEYLELMQGRKETAPQGIQMAAQGGRIGYADAGNVRMASHAGNDAWLENRMEELMELGMSFEAAAAQAQKELREGDVGPQDLAQGGRIRAQEGGLMDLGGMEKDYREEGGFVPIGGKEKADDVPARLSRNEFVFTADAVRNAGGGDIDKGAEIMENVMNNLEQGGQISDESQGLAGAQEMFDVSERLSEVV